MTDNLAFELAERRVRSFTDRVMLCHKEAMECWDCQELIQKGIEAYNALTTAETLMRDADAEGIYNFSDQHREAFRVLYAAWLKTCEGADVWAQHLVAKQYVLDNLEEFRRICDTVRETLERIDWELEAQASRSTAGVEA